MQLLSTRFLSTKRLHDVADDDAIHAPILFFSPIRFCSGLATKFFAKPRTAANATAPGTATVRTDRRQPAHPQAKNHDGHRTTASTASHNEADRQTHSRPTRQHDRESQGTATATKPATNREAQGKKQTKKHDRSTNDGQHEDEAGSGTPQTENGTTSKDDDREDQTDRQTTQQTPPDRQTKHDNPRRPPRAICLTARVPQAQCPVAR